MSIEHVYLGKDNAINVVLTNNGVVLDHTTITRATVTLDGAGVVVDSAVTAAAFSMTSAAKLVLKLGLATLPAGRYWATVTVWATGYANGLVWPTKLLLDVSV